MQRDRTVFLIREILDDAAAANKRVIDEIGQAANRADRDSHLVEIGEIFVQRSGGDIPAASRVISTVRVPLRGPIDLAGIYQFAFCYFLCLKLDTS